MNATFIDKLRERKTTFPAPEEAIDKANACNLLSRDIYTDSTRFVYELLQNADDASCKQGSLIFQIDFADDYLIVSHNGKPFDEDDVESICSIGDGSKTTDSEQTGFKGIGFKSVFAYSDMVIIKSGDFCFKFDKEESNNIWYDNWGNKSQWQKVRTLKKKSSKVSMPWQIIPINTVVPNGVSSDILNSYTVCTIIRSKKLSELRESIDSLFKSAHLILFLRSKHVKVVINGQTLLCIEKNTDNDITTISRNGEVISQWLTHTTSPFDVPSSIHEQMEEDKDHYPEKLREATKASISFAIRIEDGKIVKLDEGANNIYSFLPTTVSLYDFPFIVNSNFITDAGRQNLHQDYIWNQWLFEEMPKLFLSWIAQIAKKNQYGLDYLKIIAKKSGAYDELGRAYNQGMEAALSTIAILPNKGTMLTVGEAVFDRIELSQHINGDSIVLFINKQGKAYNNNCLLNTQYSAYYSQLKLLGVYIWDIDALQDFLQDDSFQNNHKISDNYELILFLHERYQNLNKEDKEEWKNILSTTNFIFADNDTLSSPQKLYFPTITDGEFSSDILYVNNSIYKQLNSQVIKWLEDLGVDEITDISYIEKTILSDDYINEHNAIQSLSYIFNIFCKGQLQDDILERLGAIGIITQKGSLKTAKSCYLSDYYNPDVKIETLIDDDFFVSATYCNNNDLKLQWKLFFIRIGVSEKIELRRKNYSPNEIRNSYEWAKTFWDKNNTQPNTYNGSVWHNSISRYNIFIYSLFEHVKNFSFSRLFWNFVLQNEFNREGKNDKGYSSFGYQDKTDLNDNFFEWCIENIAIVPTVQGKCELAKNVFVNNLPVNTHKYLPVMDVSCILSPEWIKILGLKTILTVSDYLNILEDISKEENTDIKKENKETIQDIYNILASQVFTLHTSQVDQITQWGKEHRIYAKDGNFYLPEELSVVLVEGFSNNNFAFTGKEKPSSDMIQLMRVFGVKVIEEVTPNYKGNQYENNEIKNRLKLVAPLLASFKDDDYKKAFSKTLSTIDSLHFYSVEQIELTYGDENDVIKKTVYADGTCIHYIGEWKKLRVLNSLAEPLAKLLHIKASYAKMLEVLLTSDINECIEYLEEYGITICDEAKKELELSSHDIIPYNGDAIVGVGLNGSEVATVQQIAESNEAKQLVLQKLEYEGFDVSKADSEYSVIHGVVRNDVNYPLVVKSCKNQEHRVWINPDEWQQLFKPNSMLWLHFGGGVVAPIKAHELFTYQDKLTLSFDTVNLMMDDRIHKIMEVLHYFNKVKLDLATLNPNKHRADNLNDYLFSDNNADNSDLDDKVEL